MPSDLSRPATPRPGARTEHGPAGMRQRLAAADLLDVMVAQRHHGQRLRLEVVEDHGVHQADGRRHALRLDDPRTVGERNLVADDRAGDRKQRRARLDAEPFQNGGADRIVDRAKSAVCTICGTPVAAPACSTTAKRALVPPMSPTRIGNSNASVCPPVPVTFSPVTLSPALSADCPTSIPWTASLRNGQSYRQVWPGKEVPN